MEKRVKVAFFVGFFPKISETWFIEQVTSLIDLGVDVHIFAFRRGSKEDISEQVSKYKLVSRTTYLTYPKDFFSRAAQTPLLLLRLALCSPASALRLFEVGRKEGFGVAWKYLFWVAPLTGKIEQYPIVHCHFGMIANQYLIIKNLLSLHVPMVTTFYGQDSSKYIQSKGPQVYDRLKRECDLLLTMTNEMKDRMVRFGFSADRVRVHYTGIVLSHYAYSARRFSKGETLKIAFVGRFVEKKGIPDLLCAVGEVMKSYTNLEVHLFGAGTDETLNAEIATLVKDLNLGARIIFHGMVNNDELHKHLRKMHVMVQLSKTATNGDTDDLPVAILEAQVTGLPVVTTRHVGIPDGVKEGESGFLVDTGDFVAAAKKILYFVEHPAEVERMGKEGRRFMEERFDLVAIDKTLIALYNKLLEKPVI